MSACSSNKEHIEKTNSDTFQITELDDHTYPDNPDIGFRAADYSFDYFKNGSVVPDSAGYYAYVFQLTNGDSIRIEDRDIMEFIPTIPEALRTDSFAAYIAVVNQEWNRNQVHFMPGEFDTGDPRIVRVDIARNCLNAYLWEVILYENENGETLPFAHGWFDFPKARYAQLFQQRNDTSFSNFRKPLENWVEPEKKPIDPDIFGNLIDSVPIQFSDQSDSMYPLKGARLKKYKEIIYPDTFQTMRDLQTDSTLFATFSPPGFYNRADPRHTELGRIFKLDGVEVLNRQCGADTCTELRFDFTDRKVLRKTILRIGGLDLAVMAVLHEEDANNGWKNPMGFANHSFYESVAVHDSISTETNPYFAYFSDTENIWLDSHKIGIDGPVMYWDSDIPNLLHVWLLSFERHAFVGHYEIQFPNNQAI